MKMSKNVILCVDDETIVLDSLKEQLRRQFGSKFSYEVATSAAEALEILDELEEDGVAVLVVVSDWMMPGIKGDELLVKVHQDYPNIVKIMITGQADPQAIENAYQNANLLKCLSKPWSEKDLVNILSNVLE
jgi:CheY-like chemotaxis protein